MLIKLKEAQKPGKLVSDNNKLYFFNKSQCSSKITRKIYSINLINLRFGYKNSKFVIFYSIILIEVY